MSNTTLSKPVEFVLTMFDRDVRVVIEPDGVIRFGDEQCVSLVAVYEKACRAEELSLRRLEAEAVRAKRIDKAALKVNTAIARLRELALTIPR